MDWLNRIKTGVDQARVPRQPTRADLFTRLVFDWERNMLRLLRERKIGVQVVDRARASQLFTFGLALRDPADLGKLIRLAEEISLVMHTETVKLVRSRGIVEVQVTLHKSLRTVLLARRLERRGGLWIALGQTPVGQPVHLNLASPRTCHVQIVGMTGSGKTNTEQLIAWQLAMGNEPKEVRIILIDAKGELTWYGFERVPHLRHPIIKDAGRAAGALAWLMVEMERRKKRGYNRPHIFLIVDETKHLLDLAREGVSLALQRVAEIGRTLGVHAVIATQHATAASVGGGIVKANMPVKLTGHVANAHAASLATGVKDSGAELLEGNGDFLVTVGEGSRRVQIGMLRQRDYGEMPQAEQIDQLDLDGFDLDRVLGLVNDDGVGEDAGLDPHAVAYALATGCGVRKLRDGFGPMGTPRAQRIRDYAGALRAALEAQGFCYPLRVTELSPETALRAGINGAGVTRNA